MRFILLISAFFLSTGFAHKFYVSMTDIHYNAANQSLEISVKVFADDLETAIQSSEDDKLWVGDKQEAPQVDGLIEAYFRKKFQVSVNGEAADFDFLGKEAEVDVIWCYLEITDVAKLESLEISHQVFMHLFDEQKNLVHIYVGDSEESLLLMKGQESGTVRF